MNKTRKNTSRITFCAILAALSTAFMLLSYFPYLTYAVPFMMIAVIEINIRWAWGAYFSSAILVFIFAETEAKLMYVLLFGYYPILKAIIEKLRKPIIEWVLKYLVFNVSVLAVYAGMSFIFDLGLDDIGDFGKYSVYILLVMANIVFALYDITVSRIAMLYMVRLHDRIKKMIK